MIKMGWFLAICTILGGIAALWYFQDKIVSWFKRKSKSLPEFAVDRKTAEEIGLEDHLKQEDYRLFWGDINEREYYLHLGDYELIQWIDPDGKTWSLTAVPGGDLPLKTKYTSQEIEQRREERKRQNPQDSS